MCLNGEEVCGVNFNRFGCKFIRSSVSSVFMQTSRLKAVKLNNMDVVN